MSHRSHPSRVRELKRVVFFSLALAYGSHPSRVRELKHNSLDMIVCGGLVAPLPGA